MKKNIKSPKHYNKRNPHYFSYSYSPRTVILLSPKPCVSYTIGFDVHLVTSSSLVIVTKSHLQKLTNLIINFWKIIAWLLRNFSRLTLLQKTKRDNETRKIGIDILCFGMWFYFRIHYQVIFFCRWQMHSEQQAPKADRFVSQNFWPYLFFWHFCYFCNAAIKYVHGNVTKFTTD